MSSTLPLTFPTRHPVQHPSGGRTSLYLVRHGRTLGNVQRVLCGSTDVPLDELGVRQADLVAKRMAKIVNPDVIVASPLQRARVTAEKIASAVSQVPVIRPNLTEWDFGVAEGMTFDQVAEQLPEIAIRFANVDDWDVGWPGGETRRQFHQRVYQEFLDILQHHHDHTVVAVAHGGVFGSLLAQIQGNHPNDWRFYEIRNCSITHLEVSVDDTAVHLMNDVEHLRDLEAELDAAASG